VRVLALDWGEVRIGAAISDPTGEIAFPFEKFLDNKTGIEEIKKIVAEQDVKKIIIGRPTNLAGQEGVSSKKVELFASKIEKEVGFPVEFVDERFTSVQAGKMLSADGVSEQKQRAVKDNIAAQIMLQQYLNNN